MKTFGEILQIDDNHVTQLEEMCGIILGKWMEKCRIKKKY